MRCEEVRRILETDYLDGRQDSIERGQVEEHLKFCRDCRQYFKDLESVSASVSSLKEDPPPFIWENIKKDISSKDTFNFRDFSILWDGFLRGLKRRKKAVVVASLLIFFGLISIGVYTYKEMRYAQVEEYLEEELQFLDVLSDDESFENFLVGEGLFS